MDPPFALSVDGVTFTHRYVVEVPTQLSEEEWVKQYSLPAPKAPVDDCSDDRADKFRHGLKEAGFIEGQNAASDMIKKASGTVSVLSLIRAKSLPASAPQAPGHAVARGIGRLAKALVGVVSVSVHR